MLESSVANIASPLACVLVLIVAGAVAFRVTSRPGNKKRYEIIDEMSEPSPAEKARQAREDEAWNKKHNDAGAWWNP